MNKQVLNSSGPMLPNTEHYVNHSAAHRVCWKLISGMNKNEYVGHNPEISWSWLFFTNTWSALPACSGTRSPTSKWNLRARFVGVWRDNGLFPYNCTCTGQLFNTFAVVMGKTWWKKQEEMWFQVSGLLLIQKRTFFSLKHLNQLTGNIL